MSIGLVFGIIHLTSRSEVSPFGLGFDSSRYLGEKVIEQMRKNRDYAPLSAFTPS